MTEYDIDEKEELNAIDRGPSAEDFWFFVFMIGGFLVWVGGIIAFMKYNGRFF